MLISQKEMLRNVKRIYRGTMYFISWLFLEKPRGLDLSLRNKSNLINRYNGYAMTSKKALENIDSFAPIQGRKFLDIGSGKGAVVLNAMRLEAKSSTGIEVDANLNAIAQKNLRVLKVEKFAKSINSDALEFSDYEAYDYYFLFNPFDLEIYSQVILRILDQTKDSPIDRILVCYGASNLKFLKSQRRIKLIHSSICPFRLNEINIFAMN